MFVAMSSSSELADEDLEGSFEEEELSEESSDGEEEEKEYDGLSPKLEEEEEEEEKETTTREDKRERSRGKESRRDKGSSSTVAGIVYLSRVPPFMKPHKVKHLLSRYGSIGRVYLKPEGQCLRGAWVKLTSLCKGCV